VREFFSSADPLSCAVGARHRYRPEQVDLASAIDDALELGGVCVGVGVRSDFPPHRLDFLVVGVRTSKNNPMEGPHSTSETPPLPPATPLSSGPGLSGRRAA
jgi:hypothetical protein